MRSQSDGVVVEDLAGDAAAGRTDELARLRIAVFREFPYLYEGSAEYEQSYLATYLASPRAVIVVARDGERLVGAATALPLADATREERTPFAAAGWPVDDICYFGESVLLPAYRGRGLGVAFFAHREAHARRLGLHKAVFCAVERAADDPRRPHGYVPLDGFWTRRGYRRIPLETTFSWPEIGNEIETPKRMLFWMKDLEG